MRNLRLVPRPLTLVSSEPIPLERKGAWLRSSGSTKEKESQRPERTWQMHAVHGPFMDVSDPSKQFFRVETNSNVTLLIFRRAGERGMRELYLHSIVTP